jgi:transposase
MLYVGLDLSRQRLDVHVLDEEGRTVEVLAVHPDADALRTLAGKVLRHGQEVSAVIESMTGSRFVHDTLERWGWEVTIADSVRAKGLAPLAAKTDKIDAHVLAELARRDLVPEIWLPTPGVRAERERARFRLHLVRHRALKCRIHATLMSFGHPIPVADLFGTSGRRLLAGFELPEPWARTLATSLAMVDELDERIDECGRELARLGADHPYVPLLLTVPGVGPLLAYTIASEIGDIRRFANPKKLTGYTGLCPIVRQSGNHDFRGPLAKNGPKYLRWALVEAAIRAIETATSATSAASAASVAPRSPGSTSPTSWPRPSGMSCPRTNRSPRQAPLSCWSHDDPVSNWAGVDRLHGRNLKHGHRKAMGIQDVQRNPQGHPCARRARCAGATGRHQGCSASWAELSPHS